MAGDSIDEDCLVAVVLHSTSARDAVGPLVTVSDFRRPVIGEVYATVVGSTRHLRRTDNFTFEIADASTHVNRVVDRLVADWPGGPVPYSTSAERYLLDPAEAARHYAPRVNDAGVRRRLTSVFDAALAALAAGHDSVDEVATYVMSALAGEGLAS